MITPKSKEEILSEFDNRVWSSIDEGTRWIEEALSSYLLWAAEACKPGAWGLVRLEGEDSARDVLLKLLNDRAIHCNKVIEVYYTALKELAEKV